MHTYIKSLSDVDSIQKLEKDQFYNLTYYREVDDELIEVSFNQYYIMSNYVIDLLRVPNAHSLIVETKTFYNNQ